MKFLIEFRNGRADASPSNIDMTVIGRMFIEGASLGEAIRNAELSNCATAYTWKEIDAEK